MSTSVPIPRPKTGRPISRRSIALSILACLLVITYLTLTVPAGFHASLAQVQPGKLSLAFVPNVGQTSAEVVFQANDMNGTVFMTASDLVFALASKGQQEPAIVRLSHQNASSNAAVSGLDQLPGKVNYISGSDPARWHTSIPTYSSIMYRGLYPGIDLKYEGSQGVFEAIYYVNPGANPALISWNQSGTATARIIPEDGSIAYYRSGVEEAILVEEAPMAYQEIDGKQVIIPSRYAQNADGSFTFALGAYDTSKTLVIDPTLVYSTYLGGSNLDTAESLVLDASGNMYITGTTFSANFPTATPIQGSIKGDSDTFIMKLNPTGTTLLYSTYLGGTGDEDASAIAVDASGAVYIAGETESTNFPTKNGYASTCFQVFDVCIPDAFLVKLSPDGSQMVYGTLLGGADPDMAEGLAVDSNGAAYVIGNAFSADFPTVAAMQSTLKGDADAFVAKVDTKATGKASLVWSTYLGGGDVDLGSAIVMGKNSLIVTGATHSSNFPTKSPLQSAYKGGGDAFIAGISTDGALVYSTYLGGALEDNAYGLAVDAAGDAYITGSTLSTDFPTSKAVQAAGAGKADAFVTGIKGDGSAWLFSTYLGGKDADYGYAISASSAGLYVTGGTQSGDYPQKNTLQAYKGSDAFVTKLNSAGDTLVYSTLLGGTGADSGVSIAADSAGKAYIVGNTLSDNFPTKNALKPAYSGQGDIFVVILEDVGENPPPDETPVVNPTPIIPELPPINPLIGSFKIASNAVLDTNGEVSFTIQLHNSGAKAVDVTVTDPLPKELVYVAATANMGGTYKDGTLTWTVTVPSCDDVKLTFKVTTTETMPKIVTNTATIKAAGEDAIQRSFAVMVGSHEPKVSTRPVVTKFVIGSQDVLTSRDVTLHIEAAAKNGGSLKWMYLREWYIAQDPDPNWAVVKSSDWIAYEADYPWKLGDQSGVHYVAVVVADDDKSVSVPDMNSLDYASLLLPDTQLKAGGLLPYLVSYDKGVAVKAQMTVTSGKPYLFVWYPGNFLIPNQTSFDPTKPVEFTTPQAGTYLFLIYAAEDTTYSLSITPAGGPKIAMAAAGATAPAKLAAGDPGFWPNGEPLLSVIGVDPLASGNGNMPVTVEVRDQKLFLPFLRK